MPDTDVSQIAYLLCTTDRSSIYASTLAASAVLDRNNMLLNYL